MAVITVATTDTGGPGRNWAVPPAEGLNKSPIPRGIRHYHGSVAVPALGAGDETLVILTHSFPSQYHFLPRNLSVWFRSDDQTLSFEVIGALAFVDANVAEDHMVALEAPGVGYSSTTMRATQVYSPQGMWRIWINGPNADLVKFYLTDLTDTSIAGDVFWACDYWIYDIEQCMQWSVNLFDQMLVSP